MKFSHTNKDAVKELRRHLIYKYTNSDGYPLDIDGETINISRSIYLEIAYCSMTGSDVTIHTIRDCNILKDQVLSHDEMEDCFIDYKVSIEDNLIIFESEFGRYYYLDYDKFQSLLRKTKIKNALNT